MNEYKEIINELKDSDFLENADMNSRLNLMLKSIDMIIKDIITMNDVWKKKFDECEAGTPYKAILGNCVEYITIMSESANSAKKNIMLVNGNDTNSINYHMEKYNKELRTVMDYRQLFDLTISSLYTNTTDV